MSNPPVLKLGGHGPVHRTPSLAAVAPDMGILSQLVDMGFHIERAKKALIESRNNMGQALDWLDRNADWEIPAEVFNQSLVEAQPGFGVPLSAADAFAFTSQERSSLGTEMQVDSASDTHPQKPSAVAIASLDSAASPAAPMASRYESSSKDAYRERMRQKEIEKARLEKLKQVEEAARLRAEVASERSKRGGVHASTHDTTSQSEHSTTQGAPASVSHATTSSNAMDIDAHTAELKAFEERKRQREAEEERKKKLQEAADRERIKREIEEERERKFGASEKPTLTPAEQKAAFEAKQKEKAKEAWKVEQDANQRRLAELRQQLKEDRERKEQQRLQAKSSAAQGSTAAPKVSPAAPVPTSHPNAAGAPEVAPSAPVDPNAPQKSAAEQLAEARRARLGITTLSGTQAYSATNPFPTQRKTSDDDDDEHLTIDQIKERNKLRAKLTSAAPEPVAEPEAPTGPESLRDIHQKRFEEQRRKEKEMEERRARAERAERMVAISTSLATSSSSSAQPTSSTSVASSSRMEEDLPLETSSSDILEKLVDISLRLPDGRVKKARFKARDPISAVHKYAASWLPLDSIFSLLIPMPRREFTEENMHQITLDEAGLAPRGILTVLTLANRGQVTAAPPRPANLQHLMGMVNYEGSEMEAAEELANMSYEELLELQERVGFVNPGLTSRELKSLPSTTYTGPAEDTAEEGTSDGAFCVVCQEDIVKDSLVVTLPKCGHMFHKGCVQQWLQNNRACPACRTRVYIGKDAPLNGDGQEDEGHGRAPEVLDEE